MTGIDQERMGLLVVTGTAEVESEPPSDPVGTSDMVIGLAKPLSGAVLATRIGLPGKNFCERVPKLEAPAGDSSVTTVATGNFPSGTWPRR
jgi:hypothetical protein